MKISRILLASCSAFGLTVAGAWADNNNVYLDQDGSKNAALIEQTGSSASAGESNAQRRMTQEGDDNVLRVLQSGAGKLGTGSNWAQYNLGVDQIGNKNSLNVTQNFGSKVFEVQQDSTNATGPLSGLANSANITQTGNMRVSRVRQTYEGDGTTGTENSLTVTQTGDEYHLSAVGDSGGFSPSLTKQGIWQQGASNTASIDQANAGQRLWLLDQLGENNQFELVQGGGNGNKFDTAEQFGDNNEASFNFSGSNNGNGSLSTVSLSTGAPNKSLLQSGSDNTVDMMVSGSYNQFGVSQTGDLNEASIIISGIGNSIGTAQASNDAGNIVTANIAGDDNDVGVSQTVGASANASSAAELDILGNNNLLNVDQNSTRSLGGAQTVMVSITGNDNNRGVFDLLGDAGGVASAAGLNPGDIIQQKNGAFAEITVIGDGNLFATSQNGNPAGSITGYIEGNSNQAAVWSVGASNTASFSQIGNGNNLGIIQ